MKTFTSHETQKNGKLMDELKKSAGANTLYVSHYFFALKTDKELIFYYNPLFFWDRVPLEKVEDYVLENLKKECAVFENSDGNSLELPTKAAGYENAGVFSIFPPRIGNLYKREAFRILTNKHTMFIRTTTAVSIKTGKKSIFKIDVNDLNALLFPGYTITTKTPNFIQSIYDLRCFQKPVSVQSLTLMGAVAGDVIGSVYERHNTKRTDFELYNPACRFTDDTVLTIAVADAILNKKDFGETIWNYATKYHGRGYGSRFRNWLKSSDRKPYYSYGNGSAMRVSAVGFAYDKLKRVLEVAKQTAEVTHNHPEGIKGAQAVAAAVFLARSGKSKQEIKEYIESEIGYDLSFTLDEIRKDYKFDVSCQGSVPQAIVAFLESSDFENAIRLAISIGGDSDTIASITGAMAAAYYKDIPKEIIEFVSHGLTSELIEVMEEFEKKFTENIR